MKLYILQLQVKKQKFKKKSSKQKIYQFKNKRAYNIQLDDYKLAFVAFCSNKISIYIQFHKFRSRSIE